MLTTVIIIVIMTILLPRSIQWYITNNSNNRMQKKVFVTYTYFFLFSNSSGSGQAKHSLSAAFAYLLPATAFLLWPLSFSKKRSLFPGKLGSSRAVVKLDGGHRRGRVSRTYTNEQSHIWDSFVKQRVPVPLRALRWAFFGSWFWCMGQGCQGQSQSQQLNSPIPQASSFPWGEPRNTVWILTVTSRACEFCT